MSADIIIVLAIVAVAVVLFVTEWVRYDGVALVVLLALAISGVIPMARAIEGFANPAVVTIAAVLVLSGGLYKTGVANLVGAQVLRLAGKSPARVTALLMLTSGLMSGVMNNTAAVALLVPVVIDISRRLAVRPSRLLIPLSFAALLGGMTTLIGTGPNILLSSMLERAGEGTFGFFSFTPVGAAALGVGVLYVVLAGRHFLPDRATGDDGEGDEVDVGGRYGLSSSLLTLRIPSGSALDGRTLVQARLGQALGFDLLAVRRGATLVRGPEPDFTLQGNDLLIVDGRLGALEHLRAWGDLCGRTASGATAPDTGDTAGLRHDPGPRQDPGPHGDPHPPRDPDPPRDHPGTVDGPGPAAEEDGIGRVIRGSTSLAEVEIGAGSDIAGSTLQSLDFRNRYHAHVLALKRDGAVWDGPLQSVKLEAGDTLLLLGSDHRLGRIEGAPEFSRVDRPEESAATDEYELRRNLARLDVPEGSWLDGRTLAETRLRGAFDLTVLEIERTGREIVLPEAAETLQAGDCLIVEGTPECVAVLGALQALVPLDERPSIAELESEDVGFAEVTLSPSSNLVGKTLREILFREAYGLTLIAVWRGGRSLHSNLRISNMGLEFGDALLLYGQRRKIALLTRDPRFLVLHSGLREVFRGERAPVAGLIMAGVILTASLNLLPVYIAALLGALLMVFAGCVKGSEVYAFVEWRVVILIGGMLALGLAMEESGAAELIARDVVGRAAEMGPYVLLASLFLVCGLAAQFIPTSAVAVLVGPIALSAATELGLSSAALVMVVAVGSSCAFLSPFGHPVNLLVMGAGGYRVTDYTRVGAPLFVLMLLIAVFFLPVVWPL